MKGYYDCGYDKLMQGVDPNDCDEPERIQALQIYPGGRKVVKTVDPSWLSTKEAAVEWLAAGSSVYVALDDAEYVLAKYYGHPGY